MPSLLVLLLLLVGGGAAAAGGQGGEAVADSKQQLLQALLDPTVTHIWLKVGVSINFTLWRQLDKPLRINRSVTLAGGVSPPPTVDFNYTAGVVQLCSGCRFVLADLVLANERRGSGPEIDAFAGEPSSVVETRNVLRLRQACTPSALAARAAAGMSRSGDGYGQAQQLRLANVTYAGVHYPDSLVYSDVSLVAPTSREDGNSQFGGYTLECHNDTRVCSHYVSEACLARKLADACVDDLIDEQSGAGQAEASGGGGGSSGSVSTSARAGIIAVVVVTCVLAPLVVCLALLYTRKRRQLKLSKQLQQQFGSGDTGSPGAAKGAPTPTRLGAVKPGWQLHSSLISPLLGPVEDDAIQFGELLGSGSFGRVFAGRWAGRDVAIKVIEHDTESIPAVESEIKLMFSFNHPHIVRLFKSVTYVSPAAKACSDTVSVTAHGSSNSRLARVPSQEAAALAAPAPAMVVAVAGGATPPGASAAASVDQQAAASTAAAAAGWTTSGSAYGDDNRPASKGQHKYSGSSSAAATDGRRRAETMLVMEFADQGTLCSYMAKLNGHAPMRPGDDAAVLQLLLLLHDAAAGLRMLHAANVIHGDLTSNNVLVSSRPAAGLGGGDDGSDDGGDDDTGGTDGAAGARVHALVADLGLSRVMEQHKTHRTTNTLGTVNHMAPEVLGTGKLSCASDVYALGIAMWELWSGGPAFRNLQFVGQIYETVVVHGLRPTIPPGMPADLQLLMESCWAADPYTRPSAARLQECLRYMIQDRRCREAAAGQLRRSQLQPAQSAPPPLLASLLPGSGGPAQPPAGAGRGGSVSAAAGAAAAGECAAGGGRPGSETFDSAFASSFAALSRGQLQVVVDDNWPGGSSTQQQQQQQHQGSSSWPQGWLRRASSSIKSRENSWLTQPRDSSDTKSRTGLWFV